LNSHATRHRERDPAGLEFKSDMTAGIMANEKFVANVMPRIPVRRFGDASDFGGIAVYIMSQARRTIRGFFVIDGGYTAFEKVASLRGALATKQSILPRCPMDCFARSQ